MKLIIQGKDLKVTEAINDYVEQKVGKALNTVQDSTTVVDVVLSAPRSSKQPDAQVAEVTAQISGKIIRAEERNENLYASIDLVADKLKKQLRRYKDKKQRRPQTRKEHAEFANESLISPEISTDREPELPPKVMRNKFFAMPPMSTDEALENLQLIDHDFYVFCNAETGAINVVYERNHGGYGIIQPRRAS